MRHVTDGELHAYLDGALDLLPQGRGGEVRDHLASCPVCAERLQDERAIRKEAQALLEVAAPPELELPPFEALRARAEVAPTSPPKEVEDGDARPGPRGPIRGMPLAWAATVVLALGVGWMGGQVSQTLPQDPAREFSGESSDASPAASGQAAEAPRAGAREVSEPSSRMSPVATNQETEAPAAGVRESSSDAAGSPLREGEAFREPTGPSSALKGLAAPAPDQSQVATGSSSVEMADVATAAPELLEAEGMIPDHSLALPGFEVLSVEWEEWIHGERALHIRQLLPMGDTLELRYLGLLMGTDPAPASESEPSGANRSGAILEHPPFPKVMEASLPPGWNQVVMKQGRGWLVARAPLTVEQLRALLRSFR